MKTIRVPVAQITADLRKGIPDSNLMKKHRLSEDGLKRLFDELVKAVSHGSSHIEVESEE